jgi:hypothetical protein
MNETAKLLGTYKGKKVYSWPVKITFGQIAATHQIAHYPKAGVRVVACSARDARDYVARDLRSTPCVEIEVTGPKGGRAAHSYWGFDSAIFWSMADSRDAAARDAAQLKLL